MNSTTGRLRAKLAAALGGTLRARVVIMFAGVLALESADLSTVGAAGPQLKSAMHISDAQLGLLAAISTGVGALVTIPVGAVVDRGRRVRILGGVVALWALAMAVSAGAHDYTWLLLSRLGLGAVTAAAGPAIASLTGDFFAPAERGRIYGYILSGELIGAAFGFVVSGTVASALSWRWAFAVLAPPALALALLIRRWIPEPARGAQLELDPPPKEQGLARRAIAARRVPPARTHVLSADPSRMTLPQAIRYVLSIRTNVWLISASAVGYFFFAGLRTFGVVYMRGRFGLGQAAAIGVLGLAGGGALLGTLVSGRLADRLIRRGKVDGRIVVAALSYLLAAVVVSPAALLSGIGLVILPLFLAGAALAAPNPPLDAARLDIMPAQLWGRAEGVRTFLRQAAQAAAPIVFGLLAGALGRGHPTGLGAAAVSSSSAQGLRYAFLIMLLPLVVSGLVLLWARRNYPTDVATAIASQRAIGTGDDADAGASTAEYADRLAS